MKIVEKSQNFFADDAKFNDFSRCVCIFDSGLGGLSVLFACRKRFPSEKFVYCGDNERAPYGNLPEEVVRRYAFEEAERLAAFSPKVLVLACNTVTALAGETLRKKYSFPVLGVYPPLFSAGRYAGEGIVLVTKATYRSAAFASLLRRAEKAYPKTTYVPYPCDDLAGKIEDTLAGEAAEYYTSSLPRRNYAFVALGCTHYAHVKNYIAAYYNCPVVDGNDALCNRLSRVIESGETSPFSLDTAVAENSSTIFDPVVEKSVTKNVGLLSSDGKVLFIGSGSAKNRTFYEHSFAEEKRLWGQKWLFFY